MPDSMRTSSAFKVLVICGILTYRKISARPEPESPDLPYQQALGVSVKLPERILEDINYFDNINVAAQLSNKKFVDLQIKCLVYDGPCDVFGRKAKSLLPSIILDNCRLCTSTQRHKLSRIAVHFQQNYPGAWRDALVKYGSGPKFITAGQISPQFTLFGSLKKSAAYDPSHPGAQPTFTYATNPVLPTPSSSAEEYNVASTYTLLIPESNVSPPPDPVDAVEPPTPLMEPTYSPFGPEFSTTAIESTIEVKPTTISP
jgi:hypothetical protein